MNDPTDNQAIERAEFISRGKCPTCSGTGDGPCGFACPDCKGSGVVHWCEFCHGFGTPSGEAAGLVCGACMGSGIESDETPD
jgi:DnaJ-class molecular chaperone